MNIMTIAHSSELNNFSIAITSKREHVLKIPLLTIWIFRLRCAVPPKIVPRQERFNSDLPHMLKNQNTFFRCAYLNTLDVFKFYESGQCCTTNSLTTFHNLICFFRFVIGHIYKIASNFQCVILVQYYIAHSK